jgi:dynein heavy chain
MHRNIQDAFQTYQTRGMTVEEFFTQNAQNRTTLENFLSGQGPPKLMIYYQPDNGEDSDGRDGENKLILTTGDNVKLEKKGVYFLRTTPPGKEVSLDKVDSDILFGELTPQSLELLKQAISLILANFINNKESHSGSNTGKYNWGECDKEQVEEFKKAAEKFETELDTSISSLYESRDECKIDREYIDKLKEQDRAGSKANLHQYYESKFTEWLNNFEKALEETDEGQKEKRHRRGHNDEASDPNNPREEGPDAELDWWKDRFRNLSRYQELISNNKDFLEVKEQVARSTAGDKENLEKRYQAFENNLTERLNEAKDNVKYLVTLEKFIKPLDSGTPEEIMETLPALMNAIKMIHTIARYYKNSQKLTNLFGKITNAMINNCKDRIIELDAERKDLNTKASTQAQQQHMDGHGDKKKRSIWDKDPGKLIAVLESCIKLNHKYKEEYAKTKASSQNVPKTRGWDFDNNVIFSKFDKFIKRVRKLIEIFSIIKQYDALEKHKNLEGIQALVANFRSKIDLFKQNNKDPLDVDSNDFDRNFVQLMQDIQKLDEDLQGFIERNFSKFKIISYSLKLLKKLKGILKSNNIKHRLETKYETILQNYGADIDGIIKRFNDNRANPPILRNMPDEAGKIIWVRHLFERLNGPIQEFPESMISHKEMRKYIDKFNLIGKSLVVYEIYFTRAWCADIERAKSCLQTPLLAMKEENNQKKIKVNFEKDIQKLIREAKALDREGIEDIPESAKIILLQEEKFKNYYYELDFIKTEYDRILSLIKPVMKKILEPHIEDLDLKIRPGMVTLTWTSMNIDGYLQHVQMSLAKLEQLIITINDIIDNRIENNLKEIGKVALVKLPDDGKPMSLEGFVDDQKTHILKEGNHLKSKNIEVERAVDDLLDTVTEYKLESENGEGVDQKAATKIKGYYYWYTYQALLNSTQNSLTAMKNRICGTRPTKGPASSVSLKPFFEVNVKLENKQVTLSPPLSKIQEAINKAATAILGCSKDLMRWTPPKSAKIPDKESQAQESFYTIIAQDKQIVKVILLLTGSFKGTSDRVEEFKQQFEPFEWLWLSDVQKQLEEFTKKNPKLSDYEEKLRKFAQCDKMIDSISSHKDIGAMSFKTDSLISGLKERCKEWKSQFSKDLHNKAKNELTEITEYVRGLSTKLGKEIKDIDSLGTVMNTLEIIRREQATIDLKFGPILDMYSLLDLYLPNQVTEKEELDNRMNLKQNWKDLLHKADEKQSELQHTQAENLKRLKANQRELIIKVQDLRRDFEEKGPKVPGIQPKEASDRLSEFKERFDINQQNYLSNKQGENLFGLQNLTYEELTKTEQEIKFLDELYKLYNTVNDETAKWEEMVWSDIRIDHIRNWEETINSFSNDCGKMSKGLREYQAYKDMKLKIDNYKNLIPLIIELKDASCIKERHWEAICKTTGKTLAYKNPENFPFRDLIKAQLLDFVDDLEEIINSGKKQKNIEKTKKEIEERWADYKFEFKVWGKPPGVQILKGDSVVQIQEDLENDISTLSGLIANKHIGPFLDSARKQFNILSEVQKTLQDWLKVQILWTSLEAVFTSGDIAKHLKKEAQKFKGINKNWKSVMNKAFELKKVIDCCQTELVKGSLSGLYDELTLCQKELDKYLEQKRKAFPRFYFVSNPVLLKFLSQGSEPESVQDELDKLFDSICKADFGRTPKQKDGSSEKTITAIKDAKGDYDERIALTAPVICAGNIEDWLLKLEKQMQETVKSLISKVYSKWVKRQERIEIPKYIEGPAQICLVGLQMRWTKVIQDAFEEKSMKAKALEAPKQEITEYQRGLTEQCKLDKWDKMQRTKLETLVLIAVYLEDVITTRISSKLNANSYDWQKYTRVYWKDDSNFGENCVISITDWNAIYSYEYLGVKERLCITPLTDRCYITLAQALSMNYGGSPVGPAGTGKTETVKDLGRTLGIFVVVTNCSGEHRSGDMAKIFKGLCQSGLWGCFDEFNRIMSEVLSVIAMQVESITNAKKLNQKDLNFPGEIDRIPLVKTCGYFITMNPPSYGGRQKLPENLKVLFRGISMMVPNREVIIQVKLASAGYSKHQELAKKFKVLYELCEEQLSKQRHYDFGLRNILSVLRTAGDSLREDDVKLKKDAEATGKEPVPPNEIFLMMRTLRDMNLSKLVAQDVPLFEALLQDIFPGQGTPQQKYYGEVEKDIIAKIEEHTLINHPTWYRKIIQVYECSKVRHGFMVIGPVGSGKSAILNILSEAISVRNKTTIIKLNPKSFTSQEMYGCNDMTGDWTPGVFSEIWDKANKKENRIHNWITCDGPVDAVWIESLNTVLDDNKVLTLANGGRVFMKETVKMVFEVENLNNASAATVSRCGQIYVSDTDLGYIPIMEGWIKQRIDDKKSSAALDDGKRNVITKIIPANDAPIISKLMKKYFVDMSIIEVFEKIAAKNPIMRLFPVLRMSMVLNLLNGLLAPPDNNSTQGSKGKFTKSYSEADYNKMILFCIMWGVAGVFEPQERNQIQEWMKDRNLDIPRPKENETIFEYYLDTSKDTVQWEKIEAPKWEPPKRIEYSQILMPTIDAAKADLLIRLIAYQEYSTISRRSALVIGGPGTAKTSSVLMYASTFDTSKMILHRINFSSATLPIHFQASIESVCEMKIQRGFGPKDQKQMTVFIDDFSMPELNKYGDQTTLEIVRQLIEDSFFYNLEKAERGNPKYIENLRYLAAMNHPGGGRNDIPNRLKRQFFIFNMTLPERIDLIFDPILKKFFDFSKGTEDGGASLNKIVKTLSSATIDLWKKMKTTLLPTPNKFHYIFNLRDISRIFKGMCNVAPEAILGVNFMPKADIKQELYMIALWRHECERVFIDKLVESKDKLEKYKSFITDVAKDSFKDYASEISNKLEGRNVFFLNWIRPVTIDDNDEFEERPPRAYEGSLDIDKVRKQAELFLRTYNKKYPSKAMDLVLFDDALFHLLRISRLIEMKRSSALLVGVGGSGKQSLTRLAAHIGDQLIQQIVLQKGFNEQMLKEWLRDNLFEPAGRRGRVTTFLLTDAEIKKEEFLEYINMVLSTGEIPGLLQKDEKETWMGDVKTSYMKIYKGTDPSNQQVYEFFVNNLRDNLHVVLCFSPVGTKFRERARKFPALFSECTIDWYLPWPKEALFNVAKQQIDAFEELKTKKEIREKELPEWMANVHSQVDEACDAYLAQMRKTVYVTPKSYLFFLKSFKKLYATEMNKLLIAEKNYAAGLQKIKEGSEKVAEQEKELNVKSEEIKAKQVVVGEMVKDITIKRTAAKKKEAEVTAEKKKVEAEAAKIKIDKDECEAQLKEAMPALQRAEDAANKIDAQTIADWKTLLRSADPTATAKYLIEAMSILLYGKIRNDIEYAKDVKATKKDTEGVTLINSSWNICKDLLGNPSLKSMLLLRANKANSGLINDEILELVEPYIELLPDGKFLSVANIIATSKGNEKLREWIYQIYLFSVNTKIIKPKQAALEIQENLLNEALEKLRVSQKKLDELELQLKSLEETLNSKQAEADQLEAIFKEQDKKIKKAKGLISSLQDEKTRWNEGAETLNQKKVELVGNAGFATAFISYCGPFSSIFRDKIAKDRFIKLLIEQKIPFSPNVYEGLVSFLVDEAKVGQWNLDGLPKDNLSIQNGIMVEASERYPLLIDPQGQGAFWIKNMYRGPSKDGTRNRVTICNPSEERKIKEGLKYCLEEGEVFILEGITGEVDPFFDPVLEKQYTKSNKGFRITLAGEDPLDFNTKFKLFITCKLGAPKFTPELSAKTTIIDFTVTQGGLEQQLLSEVLSKEQAALEEMLNTLNKKVTENKRVLLNLDQDLLKKLNESQGNLLDDEDLLDILKNTKTQSKEIKVQMKEAEEKTEEIGKKREIYRPVSIRGAVMYFCMIEIANVNWMYNSSLNQFVKLYLSSIENSKDRENPNQGKKRVEEIESYLTLEVFQYVNRGLFSSHKITFLLMVCFKIMITAGEMTEADVGMFLKVGSGVDKSTKQKPTGIKSVTEGIWLNILDISTHHFCGQSSAFFKQLPDKMIANQQAWEDWFGKNDPERYPIPDYADEIKADKNASFIKFCLIRSLKPDRTIVAANEYVEAVLKDRRFIETPAEDISTLVNKSSDREPILYLLSEGADPTSSIQAYALKHKKIVTSVSLGEGQGEKAYNLIKEYMPLGNWILLQNCHLGIDFMEQLDQNLSDPEFLKEVNPEFRIWMSCEPTDVFPLGLLQKSLKVTNEPPKGLKAGLRKTFKTIVTPDFLEKIEHTAWRSLCYVVSFLHSLMQERRKFGAIGWCIPYEFNDSDLEASLAYIEKYLNQLISAQGGGAANQTINIDFLVINTQVCDIQYGGKVSDNVDREILKAYGDKYFKNAISNPTSEFALAVMNAGTNHERKYTLPNGQEHAVYVKQIEETIDVVDSSEIFGMSVYADIACRNKETKELVDTLTDTRPKEGGATAGGLSKDEKVKLECKKRLSEIVNSYPPGVIQESVSKLKGPKGYKMEDAEGRPQNGFTVPLNVFLSQELQRMDRITNIIKKTFGDIVEAVDGQILMTPVIVDSIDFLFNNKVPSTWLYDPSGAQISWMKHKFSIWFESFKTRNITLEDWMRGTRPKAFNLDHFFNPQGLLTSMKQEICRIRKTAKPGPAAKNINPADWSMDKVEYSAEVFPESKRNAGDTKQEPSQEGNIFLVDLFIEGAKYRDGLVEATDKTLIFKMPQVEMGAKPPSGEGKDGPEAAAGPNKNVYNCPLYKYPMRTDDYLITKIPLKISNAIQKDTNASSWQLKGVALLSYCEL